MTQISAKIIADSKNEFGNRITTMIVTFPRYILAELNTHRMLSKNSASSRAIPFEKLLKSVEENPFIPIAWMKDHKGMQGTEYFTNNTDRDYIRDFWLEARNMAIKNAKVLAGPEGFADGIGLTKQLVNRLLEPFMWHTVIITATEWENFFALRCPKYDLYGKTEGTTNYEFRSRKDAMKACFDERVTGMNDLQWLQCNAGQADIHMMALAEAMWDAYNESTPKELKAGEWHIPFGDSITDEQILSFLQSDGDGAWGQKEYDDVRVQVATARCARISYTVVGEEDKPANYENDIKLHDRLAASGHWSPFEHCAKAMSTYEFTNNVGGERVYTNHKEFFHNHEGWSGNFRGFIQYRKTFNNENITK